MYSIYDFSPFYSNAFYAYSLYSILCTVSFGWVYKKTKDIRGSTILYNCNLTTKCIFKCAKY